ncbi:MAG: hypothetical protein MHM6MM_002725 [Cercozoa sp. M6MM]
MRFVAAYLLLTLAGKKADAESIKALFEKTGVSVDEEKLNKLVAELEGKDLDALVAEGLEKVGTVAVAAGGASAGAAAGGAAEEAVAEEEEEEEEESEEEMGFGGLF